MNARDRSNRSRLVFCHREKRVNTVIKLDNRRYVTVEGQASVEPWQDTPAHIKRLKDLYVSMGRGPKGTDEQFAQQMRDEERSLILITPERLYGSL